MLNAEGSASNTNQDKNGNHEKVFAIDHDERVPSDGNCPCNRIKISHAIPDGRMGEIYLQFPSA